ncbi:calcium-binding protein, partial [Xanthobacter autotrophicus]|uniref:calcium-binding protein n=1 Tax=Xanthobacter autotrophicus TaxID=280 RepID=UPI003726A5C1
GNDTYILRVGEGGTYSSPETIFEYADAGTDTLRIVGVAPDAVTITSSPYSSYYLRFGLTGEDGSTTYYDVYAPPNTDGSTSVGQYIERVAFDDGTVWDLTA